jgi:hypothetical protein
MKQEPEKLYLDLLKKALTFSLWPEPPIPLTLFNETRSPLKRAAVSWVSRALEARDLGLVKHRNVTGHRGPTAFWGFTRTPDREKRLDQLQAAIETILPRLWRGTSSSGVWRGGAASSCARLAVYGVSDRRVSWPTPSRGCPPDPQA